MSRCLLIRDIIVILMLSHAIKARAKYNVTRICIWTLRAERLRGETMRARGKSHFYRDAGASCLYFKRVSLPLHLPFKCIFRHLSFVLNSPLSAASFQLSSSIYRRSGNAREWTISHLTLRSKMRLSRVIVVLPISISRLIMHQCPNEESRRASRKTERKNFPSRLIDGAARSLPHCNNTEKKIFERVCCMFCYRKKFAREGGVLFNAAYRPDIDKVLRHSGRTRSFGR